MALWSYKKELHIKGCIGKMTLGLNLLGKCPTQKNRKILGQASRAKLNLQVMNLSSSGYVKIYSPIILCFKFSWSNIFLMLVNMHFIQNDLE